jgi:hypothetical protein
VKPASTMGVHGPMGINLGGISVLAAVTAVTYFSGVSPSTKAVAAAEREREELKARKEEEADLGRTLLNAQQRLENIQAAEKGSGLVASSALDRITRIGELAVETSVSITDLSPKPEIVGTRFNRVPITVAGLGTSVAFQALLKRLHQQYPDTQVVSLSITDNPENQYTPATFRAELVWYTIAGGSGGNGTEAGAGRNPAAQPAGPRNP